MAYPAGTGARGIRSDRLSRQLPERAAAARARQGRRTTVGGAEATLRRGPVGRAGRRRISPGGRSGQRTLCPGREQPRVHTGAVASGAGAQSRQSCLRTGARREHFLDDRPAAQRPVNRMIRADRAALVRRRLCIIYSDVSEELWSRAMTEPELLTPAEAAVVAS